jgi:hypothetical protein
MLFWPFNLNILLGYFCSCIIIHLIKVNKNISTKILYLKLIYPFLIIF